MSLLNKTSEPKHLPLGIVRTFVEKIDVDANNNVKHMWEVIRLDTMVNGLMSNSDCVTRYPVNMDEMIIEGDCIFTSINENEDIEKVLKKAKIGDIFEIFGNYYCDSSVSYEGEYDFWDWLDEVQVHKLNKKQIEWNLTEVLEYKRERKLIEEASKNMNKNRILEVLIDN